MKKEKRKEKNRKEEKEIKEKHKNIVVLNILQIISGLSKRKSTRVKLKK